MYHSRSIALLAALPLATLASVPAQAQISYGPWQRGKCEAARAESGVGRSDPLPYACGGSGRPQSCQWSREVRDCPRLRDKMRHPIQCSTRRQVKQGPGDRPPSD